MSLVGDSLEHGAPLAVDVLFVSSARRGESVEWEGAVLRREPGRVVVEVARGALRGDGRRAVVAVGTASKALRGGGAAEKAPRSIGEALRPAAPGALGERDVGASLGLDTLGFVVSAKRAR